MVARTAKNKQTFEGVIVAELNPRDTDMKYTGPEPMFKEQPPEETRTLQLISAFNWYSRYFDSKIAKEQLALYIENYAPDAKSGASLAKHLRKIEDKKIIASYGWLARVALRGLKLTSDEKSRLESEIDRLIKSKLPETVEVAVVETKTSKPNVQEIMRERAHEAAGELEGLLDEFVLSGAKSNNINVNVVSVLTEKNILPQHVSIISEIWTKKFNEYVDVLNEDDSQLVESYSHFTKHQIKALMKFCEAVLSGLSGYINVKKSSKTPRKRKPVSVEKQVSKIKFMKKFDEFNLISLHPSKIIGASEAWLYDTAKRKLWYLIADSHVGTLGVKGATILGFDSSKSGVKTVRKPAEILKKLMTAGKPAARKLFGEINSVHAQPNGRTNENLIILKAY